MTLAEQNIVDQALVDEVNKNANRTAKEFALALDRCKCYVGASCNQAFGSHS
jgi:hypothetical protein